MTEISCKRPPAGWYCTLEDGHDGPCPARPRLRFTGGVPEPDPRDAEIERLRAEVAGLAPLIEALALREGAEKEARRLYVEKGTCIGPSLDAAIKATERARAAIVDHARSLVTALRKEQ